MVGVVDGLPNGGVAEATEGADVAGLHPLHRHAIEVVVHKQLGHLARPGLCIACTQHHSQALGFVRGQSRLLQGLHGVQVQAGTEGADTNRSGRPALPNLADVTCTLASWPYQLHASSPDCPWLQAVQTVAC